MALPVRGFGLNEDGELDVVGCAFVKISGRDATKQGALVRARMVQGDCYLDTTVGVPYLQLLGEKGVDPLVLREAVRERIASVPDITEVRGSQIIVDRVERTGSVAYRFRDIFSSQPVEDET